MTEAEFFALGASTNVSGAATVGTGGIDSSSVTSGAGSTDYLYVFIDQSAQSVSTCMDPFASSQVCDRDRKIAAVRLQPGHQTPGTYPIGDGDVITYSRSAAASCAVDQGDVWETGWVEVISVDDVSTRLRVDGIPWSDPVEVTAERC